MTWNIHGCVGLDLRRDPARIRDAVAVAAPDILALQEVDVRPGHRDDIGLVDRIAAVAGPHVATSYPISGPDREYGIALFSRFPIVSAERIDLAYRRREPRTAIDAWLETPLGPLRVLATHFGLSRVERSMQITRLLEAIGNEPPQRTVVTGDFNDWRLPGEVGRRFLAGFPGQIAPRSFPARWPLFCLDRVLLSSDLTGSHIACSLPVVASDHRAVVCRVTRPTGRPGA